MRVVEMKADKRDIPSLRAPSSEKALSLGINLPHRGVAIISAMRGQMPMRVYIGDISINKLAMDSDVLSTAVELISELNSASMVFGIEGGKSNRVSSRISLVALP